MMGMGDRDRERVCCVGAGDLYAGEQPGDHRVDLHLFGIAVPDHRLLDESRRIFADLEPAAGGAEKRHPARLAELQGRLRVLVDEHLLDRGRFRDAICDQRVELGREVG